MASIQRLSSAIGISRRRPRRTIRSSCITCSSRKSALTPSASAASTFDTASRGIRDCAESAGGELLRAFVATDVGGQPRRFCYLIIRYALYCSFVVGDRALTVIEQLLTPAQVADELHVTVGTVRRWITTGELRAAKAGPRRWTVRRSDLDRFLATVAPSTSAVDAPSEDPAFLRHLVAPDGR